MLAGADARPFGALLQASLPMRGQCERDQDAQAKSQRPARDIAARHRQGIQPG